ncbi:MAG TPA: DUF4440 domain-containing protein [Caulobacteraceae bacterium]|nr:DUF4440 domain-containing protein [Caulobacteraceae bacterium]
MRPFLMLSMLLSLAVAGCNRPGATDEAQAIRDIETRWNQMIVERDLKGIVGLYADDGVVMAPNMPPMQGPGPVTQVWGGLFQLPGFKLTITPVEVTVARSGDLAMDRGVYALTTTGPAGEVVENGKYVVVWKKVGEEWKVAADIFNANAAPAAPAPEPAA